MICGFHSDSRSYVRPQRSMTRGRDVREEDVRPLDDLAGELLALVGVHVEEQVVLSGVEVVEVTADVVAGLVLREGSNGTQGVDVRFRLDANYGRAVRRQVVRADRASAKPREVGDLYAFESAGHGSFSKNSSTSWLVSSGFSIWMKCAALTLRYCTPG